MSLLSAKPIVILFEKMREFGVFVWFWFMFFFGGVVVVSFYLSL